VGGDLEVRMWAVLFSKVTYLERIGSSASGGAGGPRKGGERRKKKRWHETQIQSWHRRGGVCIDLKNPGKKCAGGTKERENNVASDVRPKRRKVQKKGEKRNL